MSEQESEEQETSASPPTPPQGTSASALPPEWTRYEIIINAALAGTGNDQLVRAFAAYREEFARRGNATRNNVRGEERRAWDRFYAASIGAGASTEVAYKDAERGIFDRRRRWRQT